MRAKAKIKRPLLIRALGLGLSLTIGISLSVPAKPAESCIQDPKRSEPCPHQIYKLMQLKADVPAKVTCVCITDFEQFLTKPKNDTAIVLRKMNLKQLAADLQLTEQQVADLAKR